MAESYSESTPQAEEIPLDPNSPNYTTPKVSLPKVPLYYDLTTPEKPRSISSKSTISDYPKSYNEDLLLDYQTSIKKLLFFISAIKKPHKRLAKQNKSWKIWQSLISKNNLSFAISTNSLFGTPSKYQPQDIPNITFSNESMASLIINGMKIENQVIKTPKWKKIHKAPRKIKNAISSAELRHFYKKKTMFNRYKKTVLNPKFVPAKKPIVRMRMLALRNDIKIFAKYFRRQFLRFYSICIEKSKVDVAVSRALKVLTGCCENQKVGAFWRILEISNRLKTKEIIKKQAMKSSVKLLDNAINYWTVYGKEMLLRKNYECRTRFLGSMVRVCIKKLRKYFFSIVSQNLKSLRNIVTELDKKMSLSRGKKFLNWRFQCSFQRHILKYKHQGATKIHKTLCSIQKNFLLLSFLFIKSSASSKIYTHKPFSILVESSIPVSKASLICWILLFIIMAIVFI
ncbi:hypothetical protein SteCoe_10504 [Stentor coeruleus]|uniref:Uncharacterized protein n=1 Tax=Stentor coeruleus TaxID=5963 RepID=A0A1R2CFF3_9CILI|nr:hypothetical protein SteCoe_10504 [Stentor coeruleus]